MQYALKIFVRIILTIKHTGVLALQMPQRWNVVVQFFLLRAHKSGSKRCPCSGTLGDEPLM